ncbi:uncharacterized protein METZ01_LOCUS445943, partial [marine metagenome]
MKTHLKIMLIVSFFLLAGCSDKNVSEESVTTINDTKEMTRDIIGNNAFLYYKDYDEAVSFYQKQMGYRNVFEFPGFAMIV